MPSTSKKQHNFMAAIANSPSFAKKTGVPSSVGKDFINADKGRKFKEGGGMATKSMKALFAGKETKAEEKAEKKAFPGKMAYKKAEAKYEGEPMKKGGGVKKMALGGMTKMGSVRTAAPSRDGVASKGKTQGKMVKMNYGGKAC
jgi:hypothetical protein